MRKRFGKFFLGCLCLAMLALAVSCNFVNSFSEEPSVQLSFDTNISSVRIGEMDVINLNAGKDQNKISVRWEYDSSIIDAKTDNYAAIITGLKPGQTTLKAICGASITSCMITVSDESYGVTISNPYVYASNDYIELKPNQTQRISASLFGGLPSDINGFSWSIDKPSVASLSTEGNYCWITGVNDGIAKLTVKHNKAAYGYSVLINCTSDGTTLTYVTTDENIITINKSKENTAEFAVDLANPLVEDYASGFTYSVIDELGKEVTGALVISGAGSLSVSVTAYDVGNYYVRCSHPSSNYPLDVLVRVIEDADTAYIEPSSTQVTVTGTESQTVTLSLANYTGEVDNDLFSWNFSNNSDKYISYEIFNGVSDTTGDTILIKGVKTGTCKLTVSYPGLPDRNIIVLVRDIEGEAASAKTYITTSQNYIRLGKDDGEQTISITLTESKGADINDLRWSIVNNAADGSTKDVIQWVVGAGTSVSSSANSRAASTLVENARAYATIKPVNPGIAYIDISHPKAIYKTRITVTVTETSSSLAEVTPSLSLSGSPVVNILNGQSNVVSVALGGDINADGVEWVSSNASIQITPNGNECVIIAPTQGSGVTKGTITASHRDATSSVVYSVLCYDTQEQLEANAVQAMYALNTNASMFVGNSIYFILYTENFPDSQLISWSATEGAQLIDFETSNGNKTVTITARKVGKAVIKASSQGCDDVYFFVDIKDPGIIDDQEASYLSTYTNVLYFKESGERQDLVVSAFNLNDISFSDMEFTCDSPDFEIVSNGNKATITALKDNATAVLVVSHPLSENTLEVNLHCGEQYQFINEDFCFISTDNDVLELYAGQDSVQLTAMLNHTERDDGQGIPKGFTFTSSDTDVVAVSSVAYSNYCYVEPKKNGTARITITHPDSDFEKEVVVVVNHAPDSSSIPYLTTKTNVITIVQGEYTTASVELKNSTNLDTSKWQWSSNDSRTADVVANNGSSAMISANKAGVTELTVKHDECLYSLKIVVVVLDSKTITSRPYIKSSDNIITIKKGTSTTITAEMIGGKSASDNNYFRFNGSNSSIILVNAASEAATIKGMNVGMAYVTITNNRYSESYSKTVLVIVEDTQVDGVYIKASSSIVKMKPDQEGILKVTAELVGGEPTDGEKFIWWVDDPNLVAINGVASQCSITPTGRSGTTKVHVKHEKSLKVCDILVMISDYDTFSFAQKSLNVSSEKLYFIPMQVPAIEEEFTIEYESSSDNICIVQGSNAVAWICGRDFGNASLTARMRNKDGIELASAEMLVSVTVPEIQLPTISLGNSIMTVEAGTSHTLSAVISGQTVDQSEKYNLKWSWVGEHKDGISILDENPEKIAYGADTYVTFHEAGEYVLTVEHEASGAFTSMYIIVEDKGEITIELNSNLETIYKDDGSFTLTATLTNAAEKDYKNIEWSAVKVGGQSIVAVSKAKGKTCTVTPKNVGQTTVIAKLPNGKTAKCVVIVKAAAELTLDLGAIHIIPGYTEVVNYTTSPENASINWISQMASSGSINNNTNYFSFEDDRAKRQLRITGLKDYPGGAAGTISGYIMGAATGLTELKVYVEYDVQLSLLDMNGNHLTRLHNDNPDTANVQQFQVKYYPVDLDIDIIADGKILACAPHEANTLNHDADNSNPLFSIGDMSKKIITEDGISKCLMTVSVIPHSEGTSDIRVKATLPTDTSDSYSKTEVFMYTAYYKEYDLEIDWESYTPVGAFTRYSSSTSDPTYLNGDQLGVLYIGDGEEAQFTVRIKNENAAGKIIPSQSRWVPDDMGNSLERLNEIQLTNDSEIYKRDGSVTRLEKAKAIFGRGDDDASVKTSAQEVATKDLVADTGVIYFTTEEAAGQTLFKLSHNWDFYKDLPDEVVGDKWTTYRKNNLHTENFISNLQKKGVDAWMITKEMFIFLNQTRYYMTEHESVPNDLILTPQWTSGTDHESWWHSLVEERFADEGWSRLQAGTSSGTKKEIFYAKHNDGSLQERSSAKYHTCIPYVMSTDDVKSNLFFVVPDNKDKLNYYAWNWWGTWDSDNKVVAPKKLLHDYATPTVTKDTSVVGRNGSGVLNIAFQQSSSGEVKTIPLQVQFERRDCEAYTNGSWRKVTGSPGSTKWVLSEDLYDGTIGVVDPYFDTELSVFSTYNEINRNGYKSSNGVRYLRIPYEVYPSDITFTVTPKATSSGNTGDGEEYKPYGSLQIGKVRSETYTYEVPYEDADGDTYYSTEIGKRDVLDKTITSHEGGVVNDVGKGYLYIKVGSNGFVGAATVTINTDAMISSFDIPISIPGENLFTVSGNLISRYNNSTVKFCGYSSSRGKEFSLSGVIGLNSQYKDLEQSIVIKSVTYQAAPVSYSTGTIEFDVETGEFTFRSWAQPDLIYEFDRNERSIYHIGYIVVTYDILDSVGASVKTEESKIGIVLAP